MSDGPSRFQDHFSTGSDLYARYRPRYPAALFDFLAAEAPDHTLAWDCACGSGQATEALGSRFRRVLGTDASIPQIVGAENSAPTAYAAALAEAPPLAPGSVDLVTVAQAFHWLDFEPFHGAVKALLRPGGLVAVWCYTTLALDDPELDALLNRYYHHTVGPYWPPERRFLEAGYRDLPFPYEPVAAPALALYARWTLDQLLGYLRTWSATRRFQADRGSDPVAPLAPKLADVWGPDETCRIRWPLALLVGRRSR